jgi:hypothetical protein
MLVSLPDPWDMVVQANEEKRHKIAKLRPRAIASLNGSLKIVKSLASRFSAPKVVTVRSEFDTAMLFYHHGAAVHPSAVRVGNAFVARVIIRKQEGEVNSLVNLGTFASKAAAVQFAIRSGMAFVDDRPLPAAPFQRTDPRAQERPAS